MATTQCGNVRQVMEIDNLIHDEVSATFAFCLELESLEESLSDSFVEGKVSP